MSEISDFDSKRVVTNIPLNVGSIQVVELFRERYEWTYVNEHQKVIYQSENNYGQSYSALRDGLITVIGEPDRFRMLQLQDARKTIEDFKY